MSVCLLAVNHCESTTAAIFQGLQPRNQPKTLDSAQDIQEHRNYNSYHFARSAQARECLWLSQGGGAKPYESWSDEFVRTRQIQMLPVTGDPRCKRQPHRRLRPSCRNARSLTPGAACSEAAAGIRGRTRGRCCNKIVGQRGSGVPQHHSPATLDVCVGILFAKGPELPRIVDQPCHAFHFSELQPPVAPCVVYWRPVDHAVVVKLRQPHRVRLLLLNARILQDRYVPQDETGGGS